MYIIQKPSAKGILKYNSQENRTKLISSTELVKNLQFE